VNIVSHNPPGPHRAVLIIFDLNLQTITITWMLSSGGGGGASLLNMPSEHFHIRRTNNII